MQRRYGITRSASPPHCVFLKRIIFLRFLSALRLVHKHHPRHSPPPLLPLRAQRFPVCLTTIQISHPMIFISVCQSYKFGIGEKHPLPPNPSKLHSPVVVVWQLSCRGSYHFLKRDCVSDPVPLYQSTHWNWYSFRRHRKDDRLSQPPGVLIQRPTGLELRTLGSQAATLTTEPTPGSTIILRGEHERGGEG